MGPGRRGDGRECVGEVGKGGRWVGGLVVGWRRGPCVQGRGKVGVLLLGI